MRFKVAAAAVAVSLSGLALFALPAAAQDLNNPKLGHYDGDAAISARPYGARYIPGVGFRYIVPGGPQVYGYTRYARGYYYAAPRGCTRAWFWDRCRR